MHYLIDGYNLLFRHLRSTESLQKQRNELIENMASKVAMLHLDATIIFDSHYQPTEGSKHHLGQLEIIYTNPGETADEYILKLLKDLLDPSKHTVVTSDKVLANLCRMRLAKTMPIDEFLAWIQRRRKNIISEKKQPPKLILRPLLPQPIPSTPTTIEPTIVKEHTLEDYERIFTDSLNVIEQELHNKRADKKNLKGKKRAPKKQEKCDRVESDMARWLEAFEKDKEITP